MLTKQEIKKRLLDTTLFNDDKYLDKYCEICTKNDANTQYIEFHHIYPRSLSKFLKEEVDNSSTNFAKLSFKNHIRVHILLSLSSKNNRLFIKFNHAINKLLNNKNTPARSINHNKLIKLLKSIEEIKLWKNKKYENDIEFYNFCNSFNTLAECAKKSKVKQTRQKYLKICKRYDLINYFSLVYTKEENFDFYNKINTFSSTTVAAKMLHLKNTTLQNRYLYICKKYHLPNQFKWSFTKEEDKKFYESCNLCETLSDHDKKCNLKHGYSRNRYSMICKKYNWTNLFIKEHSFEENKKFYDECNNCSSLAEHDRKYGLKNDFSKARYRRICQKYKWPNKFKASYTEQENVIFYDSVNCFTTMKAFALKNNLKEKSVQQRYRRICQKYKWPNKFDTH